MQGRCYGREQGNPWRRKQLDDGDLDKMVARISHVPYGPGVEKLDDKMEW